MESDAVAHVDIPDQRQPVSGNTPGLLRYKYVLAHSSLSAIGSVTALLLYQVFIIERMGFLSDFIVMTNYSFQN